MNNETRWQPEVHLASGTLHAVGLAVLICAMSLTGCGVAPVAKPAAAAAKGKAGTQFDVARQLVHRGKFDEAVSALDAFLKSHPNHKNVSRAVFLRAKSKMGLLEREAAQTGFQDVIARFPNSDEARKSEFKLAMLEFLSGNVDEAKRQFATIEKAANGPYTPEATAWSKYLADEAK